MASRLVALDEGSDIPVDRAMLVVGRHPQCDARLDSIRVSRRHCCMTQDNGEVIVRDLGSTNGIRINGQRVEMGRLRPGDELSIAHIRYRLDGETSSEKTLADSVAALEPGELPAYRMPVELSPPPIPASHGHPLDNPLAAAVRDLLPSAVADRCRIQVIVQMNPDGAPVPEEAACQPDSSR